MINVREMSIRNRATFKFTDELWSNLTKEEKRLVFFARKVINLKKGK